MGTSKGVNQQQLQQQQQQHKSIILEPNELHFNGPLIRPSITLVTLKNPNNFDIMYKFKTTAPRIYRVRPNLGIVLSNDVNTVRIVLMPFAFDLKERLIHKFMILTTPAPEEFTDIRQAWSELDEDKMWCDKFKSIVDMGKSMSPLMDGLEQQQQQQQEEVDLSQSNTSEMEIELEMEMPASTVGDSSQSDNYFQTYYPSSPPPRPPQQQQQQQRESIESTTNFSPMEQKQNQDQDVKFAFLRNENNKLLNENEILRRENSFLNIELERLRGLKIENHHLSPRDNELIKMHKKGDSGGHGGRGGGGTGGGGRIGGSKLMLFLATSVTMAILCTVIGKCIFAEQLPLDGIQNFLEYMVY